MESCFSSSCWRYLHAPRSPENPSPALHRNFREGLSKPMMPNMESNHHLNRFLREEDQTPLQHLPYRVLKEADISQRQLHDITEVCSTLSVSRSAAIILLRHCNWNVSKLFDNWFDEEDEVRITVGLFKNPPVDQFSTDGSFTCEICFETFPGGDDFDDRRISSTFCDHFYCRACWVGYISKSIANDGLGCLSLKCPHPCCGAAVGEDMIFVLVAESADKDKYLRYLLRSYVEDSYRKRKIKWCPAPGCDHAVDFVDYVDGSGGACDVSCLCSYIFCWNCNEEAHSPVKCDTVAKWMLKHKDESENTNWILVNTKPCPECKRPIEKNQGCSHMRCRAPCKFEFCWICLGPWGGSHSCNSYLQGVKNESDKRKEVAKLNLDRYVHYYERWVANHESRKKALVDFQLVQDVHLKKLDRKYRQTNPILSFITEAWQKIIECRRVLKWSYAYGYYIPKHEHGKRQFFEYLQGEAESGLEKLHHCAEVELEEHINADKPIEDFMEFRTKLVQLIVLIGNYFKNLVRAMENDLPEISSYGDYWSCYICTYVNEGSATMCVMCCSESPVHGEV